MRDRSRRTAVAGSDTAYELLFSTTEPLTFSTQQLS
jgi:hypothetical protein